MIRLEHLSKRFQAGDHALHALTNVDLSVEAGQVFGVIGSSGAGKSTLIRCVNLLERPDAGKVFVDGHELTALAPRALADARRAIGMVFQQANLLASRTIAGNVALPLELAGVPATRIEERVHELLSLVGVGDKHAARPAQLSGGQRQRVTIARALANHPKVLLCDEATSALDPATTRSILDLLRDLNRRLDLTILLITHEMEVVKSVCDRVAILSEGRVVEQGSVEAVFARAKSEHARSFMRATRHLELPEELRARLSLKPLPGGSAVVRVELAGDPHAGRLVSLLTRTCGVEVDVLGARTDHIDGRSFGAMLLGLAGGEHQVTSALAMLRARDVGLEVLGYVGTDA